MTLPASLRAMARASAMWLAMIAVASCGRTALSPLSGRPADAAPPDLAQEPHASDANRSIDTASARDDASARDAASARDTLDAATDTLDAATDALDAPADMRDAGPEARDARREVGPAVAQFVLDNGVSCARLIDGTATCWGIQAYGPGEANGNLCEVGPVAIPGLTGIVDLATSGDHSCAAFTDGSVQCWGMNFYGDLGDGTKTDSDTPVTVLGLDHAVQLALNGETSCARLADGTVRCWGGPFGTTPTQISNLQGATQISADWPSTCAVLDDGTVACWDFQGSPTPVPVEGLAGVRQLAVGFSHSCAMLSDGTVWCWGVNSYGELGNGTQVGSKTPVQVQGITGARQVVVGYRHSCARLGDGTVWCWGYDFDHELADYDQKSSFTLQATQVPGLSDAQDIAAGTNHTCARLGDGSLWCWGEDFDGELGDGQSGTVCAPHDQPTIKQASFLFAGGDTSCVLDGVLGLACWGLVTQPTGWSPSPVTIALSQTPSAGTVAAGDQHMCVVRTDSTVACWGNDLEGQLGDGLAVTYVDAQHPVTVPDLDQVSELSLGQAFSCALRFDHTVACWGVNDCGQAGDGSLSWTALPHTIPGLADVAAIRAGGSHVCAILADRTVACWGANHSGQLGPGETAIKRATPVAVPGLSGVVALAAGSTHTCALLDDQHVACWGNDQWGQLGVDLPPDAFGISTPTRVPSLDHVIAIAAGEEHSCALIADGTVSCWGEGDSGQLGDGKGTTRTTPAPVSGLTNVVQIALGDNHSCARLADGTVECWGWNVWRQVGLGFEPYHRTPVRVQGLP